MKILPINGVSNNYRKQNSFCNRIRICKCWKKLKECLTVFRNFANNGNVSLTFPSLIKYKAERQKIFSFYSILVTVIKFWKLSRLRLMEE